MDVALLLRRSPVFAPLGDGDLDTLARSFTVSAYPAAQVFIKEGERGGGSVFLLVEGVVEVSGAAGEMNLLRPGALFGLAALADEGPSSATCRAAGDCRVATLSRPALRVLFNQAAPIAYAFQRAVAMQLARDFRHLDSEIRKLLVKPAVR